MTHPDQKITQILESADPSASGDLLPLVYEDLRRIARYRDLRALQKAQVMLGSALSLSRAMHSGDHEDTAMALTRLGTVAYLRDDHATAETLFRELVEMWARMAPGGHKEWAITIGHLGMTLGAQGDQAGAERQARDSVAMLEGLAPGSDVYLASALQSLGSLLKTRGDRGRRAVLSPRSADREASSPR